MAKNGKKQSEAGSVLAEKPAAMAKGTPRSLTIAQAGIRTSHDYANFMSSLMSDLIEGNVAPQIGNAAVNPGGKLLKVVEMQYKYGTAGKDGSPKTLVLSIQEHSTFEMDIPEKTEKK